MEVSELQSFKKVEQVRFCVEKFKVNNLNVAVVRVQFKTSDIVIIAVQTGCVTLRNTTCLFSLLFLIFYYFASLLPSHSRFQSD